VPAVTSLTLTHPNLALEWSSTLNKLPAESYSKGSTHKAWWNCSKSHTYEANISARVRGTGCPYCSGRKAIPGVNDVSTLHPHLNSEWHPDNTVSLKSFRPGSQEKGLWQCLKGHQWEAKIRDRVNGSGCHICAGKAIQVGHNDLATTHPLLVSLWDHDKNTIKPFEIMGKSEKKVFFKCDNGHAWENSPSRQSQVASGCSYCAGRKALPGNNDLLTLHPGIASEWHPTKNDNLLPSMVTGTMDKKVWWLGSCGHEWESVIHSRVGQYQGCPYCAGRKALKGFNDLTTKHPELASEWDHILNEDLKPEMFTRGSNQKVYWKCNRDHSWIAKITDRSVNNSGCPNCAAGKSISKNEQEIADFLKAEGLHVLQSDRLTLNGMELDILLPELNFAIEFNGLYWHTEKRGKTKYYHHDKWKACKQSSIQLVQIWEDEWKKNPKLIKNMILHKLGINKSEKIYARKTYVSQVSLMEARQFLEENHIQGFASGSYYLGLKIDKKLNALIVLKKESGNQLNIIRYATNAPVVGGFTKLLNYAERTIAPNSFVTFSDHCVSDGSLYASNGFIKDKEIEPDYRYVIGMKRQHKYGYRLKRFKNDPLLLWQEGLTERKLAELNGIDRIWDAGKIRWIKICGK
jgi:hypothetical protein